MAKQNEHGRIIATAAKATLLPIGCRRICQSRCCIFDHRYWIIFIEFQPSAWAKGSYLNVTPHWLWLRYGANDYHPRPADFIRFENAEQFTPLIEDMAAVAARTVLNMRARFRTPEKVHRFFAERISQDPFPLYQQRQPVSYETSHWRGSCLSGWNRWAQKTTAPGSTI